LLTCLSLLWGWRDCRVQRWRGADVVLLLLLLPVLRLLLVLVLVPVPCRVRGMD